MAAPKLPQRFGPYTLHELVARGGMAEVYRATMPGVGGFEKTVAIKKILPHLAENEEFITMLVDEARIIVSINHANIAQVYDLGKIDEDYYIAMEYIHGIDLSTIVKELKDSGRTVPVEHALFIASGIAAGLHVAHNKCDDSGRPLNIVHRDVSPHNILISFGGDVKIIDFGVAKARGKETHTQMGVIKGKLLYMAPEQAMAKDLDGRADLFAMGLILYRMLTNHLPFEGENEFQIYNHIMSKEITPPRTFNPQIPEEVNQIIMMLLARDPSKRYQDGYSAKVDLDRALQNVAPGYSISRLSRWVETDFSHLIQRRMSRSGQNEAPSTPPHNQVTGGTGAAPWDTPSWDDEIDPAEDTVNVAMDGAEAQKMLEIARQQRAEYEQRRSAGQLPPPPTAPWDQAPMDATAEEQQWGVPGGWDAPAAGSPGGGNGAAWGGPSHPPAGVPGAAGPNGAGGFAPYPAMQPEQGAAGPGGQYPGATSSGQYPYAGAAQSGQFPYGAAQSGQYPYAGAAQSGQYPYPGAIQSGQYPYAGAGESGQFPAGPGTSGQFPSYPGANASGQFPQAYPGAAASGQFPNGGYASPYASGSFAPPGGAPYYQPYEGSNTPGLMTGGMPVTEAPPPERRRSIPLPLVGILVLVIVIAGLVIYQKLNGGAAAVAPATQGETNGAAVEVPTEAPEAADAPAPADTEAAAAALAAASSDAALGAGEAEADAGAAVRQVGLTVKSEPEGASVYSGEELLGSTPLETQIPWGESEVTLRVELEGYEVQEITAIPFANVKRKLTLEPLPGTAVQPEPEPEVKPAPAPKKSTKRTTKPKRRTTSKPTSGGDPAVPLLLEPLDEPKKKPADVPLF